MRTRSLPALWIALLLAVACSDQVTQPPEPVASVVVQPDVITLRIGESRRLSALARARDGRILEGRSIQWTTENDAVAGVSAVGEAIARREGVVKLRASVEGKGAEATVTVLPVVLPVARVSIEPTGDLAVEVGSSLQLTAVAYAENDSVLGDRTVTWGSNHSGVATSSASGLVQALAPGTARITATVEGVEAHSTVTVTSAAVARVELTAGGAVVLYTEETRPLGARAYAANGTEITGRPITWTIGDAAVAEVSTAGLLKGLTVGLTTVTAAVEGKSAQATVEVRTRVVRIDMDPTSLVLGTGEARTITATPRGAGDIVLSRPLTWLSSNPGVATVDAGGRITATGAGDAVVTAVVEGVEGQTALRVVTWSERPLQSVGDSVLPTTLFTRTSMDGSGAARSARVVAREGRLRMIETGVHAGRYEQAFEVTIIREGEVAEFGQLVYAGTWLHDIVADSYTFYPWSGSNLTARRRPNGTLLVTGALEPNTRELTLSYRAP